MAKYVISKESETETINVLKGLVAKIKDENEGNIPESLNGSLYMLEDAYNNYIQISRQITEDGLMKVDRYGNLNKHPLLSVKLSTKLQIIKLLGELQMTPKTKEKKKEVEQEADEECPLITYVKKYN